MSEEKKVESRAECSYCRADMEPIDLRLEDNEGNVRNVCVKCWIKVFDTILGKPSKK